VFLKNNKDFKEQILLFEAAIVSLK